MKPQDVPFHVTPKKFASFRNIATCSPSQNLFDDIAPPAHFKVLYEHENASSGIDHQRKKLNRPFQYGETHSSLYVFEKLNWKRGRFGNGMKYGVWYGALQEETSRLEILYHLLARTKELFENPKISDPHIVYQRAMLKARCFAPRHVDLTEMPSIQKKLTDDDYVFCRQLGERAVDEGIGAFFAPSARLDGGICTPIFNSAVIQKDEIRHYFDFIIHRDLQVEYRKLQIEPLPIPSHWKI